MATNKFELQITGLTTAYLKLPTHPEILRHAKNVTLVDVLGVYKGPYVVFDFNSEGVLVGIEIVGDDESDSDAEMEETNAGSTGFLLNVSEDDGDVAYLRLPSYPEDSLCKMSKSVRLQDIMGAYEGPDIVLDFDLSAILVGIEVLA